ncbi:MAG: DUF3783 domain-containing protein [Clostridium sp.]|nr:DUF3783 domain-containing protein [Clostridium sp.]
MKRNDRKVLLVFGLDSMDLARLELMGYEMVIINEENGGGRIRDLIENKGKPVKGELPDEKVVIFNGYKDEALQKGVQAIRSSFPVKPIIAAVTDHSYNWAFEFLLIEHLIQDRDWNRKNAKEYREAMMKENREEAERLAKEEAELLTKEEAAKEEDK